MKLIGETKDGFILNASKEEVANILGEWGKFSDKAVKLEVGDTIEVSEMYKRIHGLDIEISHLKQLNEDITNFLKRYE